MLSVYIRLNFKRYAVDTGRTLNEHKVFRRRPGRLLNVLRTFNVRLVSTGNWVRNVSWRSGCQNNTLCNAFKGNWYCKCYDFPPSYEVNIIILLLAFLQVHKDHILTIDGQRQDKKYWKLSDEKINLDDNLINFLIGLHIITGNNWASSFFRKDKKWKSKQNISDTHSITMRASFLCSY